MAASAPAPAPSPALGPSPAPAALTHRGAQDDAEVEAQRLPVLLQDLLLALGARLALGLWSRERRSAASPGPRFPAFTLPPPLHLSPAPPLTAMAPRCAAGEGRGGTGRDGAGPRAPPQLLGSSSWRPGVWPSEQPALLLGPLPA